MKLSDKRLVRLASEFRAGILDGGSPALMCAAVSYPLQGYLSALGVETRVRTISLEGGDLVEHVVLELPDGRVLDVTADQFGLDPVYLGPMPDYERLPWVALAGRR